MQLSRILAVRKIAIKGLNCAPNNYLYIWLDRGSLDYIAIVGYYDGQCVSRFLGSECFEGFVR
jgi:hypothetical protein